MLLIIAWETKEWRCPKVFFCDRVADARLYGVVALSLGSGLRMSQKDTYKTTGSMVILEGIDNKAEEISDASGNIGEKI